MTAGVQVKGGATAEELGAVLALLRRAGVDSADANLTGYELWRRNRLEIKRSESAEPPVRTNR